MSNLIEELLKTYYGISSENQIVNSSGDHAGTMKRYNVFKDTVPTDYIIDPTEDDSSDKGANTEANNSENDGSGDDFEEVIEHSSRIIIGDEDTNDKKVFVDDKELIADSYKTRKNISDDTETDTNLMLSANRVETHNEPIASQASLGILEVLVQDNVSEVSSLAPKKKTKKKSRTITSAPTTPIQLPPVRFRSPVRKTPTRNEEFFDTSDALITEFPVNLLGGIRNIRMLYLENNYLTYLPDELFTSLRFLEWLDIRHNKLTTFPPTMKHHPSLETILLERNQFERLPLEIGTIPHLKGLQTQGNPLIYPPVDILALGFVAIINFLRKQWNANHPDEIVNPPREVKSELTILCHDPPSVHAKYRSTKKVNTSSSLILPKLDRKNPSIREKSWSYKPSNRWNSSGMNAILEAKLQWISKLKEKLNKQAAVLQKMKDQEVLKKWRQDRRSAVKSMKKAADRTSDNIPYAVDYTDISLLCKQKPQSETQVNLLTKDVNSRMSEISMSLAKLHTDQQLGTLDIATELKRLQEEIGKLSNLQREIHDLKNLNQTSMSKYNDVDSFKLKTKYKPPPSIII